MRLAFISTSVCISEVKSGQYEYSVPLFVNVTVHAVFALILEILAYSSEKDRALLFVNRNMASSLMKTIELVLSEVSDCILIVKKASTSTVYFANKHSLKLARSLGINENLTDSIKELNRKPMFMIYTGEEKS